MQSGKSTIIQTYSYTGEYLGGYNDLVYLRARMYAPGMGRFLTRDTWGGDSSQPMSYNVWLYGYANPIRYTDPSGYVSCDPLANFSNETESKNGTVETVKEWRDIERSLVCQHMGEIAQAYAKIMNSYKNLVEMETGHHYPLFSSSKAFALVHGGAIEVKRMRKPKEGYGPGGQWVNGYNPHIEIYDIDDGPTGGTYFQRHSRLIVHEMGHAFLGTIKDVQATDLNFDSGKFLRPWDGSHYICSQANAPGKEYCKCSTNLPENPYYYGYAGQFEDWQFGYYVGLEGGRWREEIADMYVGWVYDTWGNNQLGRDRSSYMAVMMFGQIVKKMPEFRQ